MSSDAKTTQHSLDDQIDHIAKGLPDDVRAEYYRVMMHCRELPQNDEMLRILNALKILTLLTVQVPDRLVHERESLEEVLRNSVESLKQIIQSSTTYQQNLDGRLRDIPQTILKDINPATLTAKINESLQQQFIRSQLPQIARALGTAATDIRAMTTQFESAAEALGEAYRGATANAERSIREMQSAITDAAEKAGRAVKDLVFLFEMKERWTVYVIAGLALIVGVMLGMILPR